ncbi:MAG TPA: S8 family peptidase [Herpetosiphonaceae bacterium]
MEPHRHPPPGRRWLVVLALVGLWLGGAPRIPAAAPLAAPQRIILRGGPPELLAAQVKAHGGAVTGTLRSIQAVAAVIPADAAPALARLGLTVMPDGMAVSADDGAESLSPPPGALLYPSQAVGATALHGRGLDGSGVTVAIIDSGMPPLKQQHWTQVTTNTLRYEQAGKRIIYKDLVTNAPITNSADPYGHGTHVLATIADGRNIGANNRLGVAPGADLAVLRVLDAQGLAPYSRVIQAIDWVIANKQLYNIKVLNLSLQAPIHGPYWHDPLAQAVMAAWAEGITVVVAAGNHGPGPATVTVPGNVPYVVTVGALRPGAYTANGVDQLAPYSSAGPTESKFVKPDVVIAGSRVIAPMPESSALEPLAGLARERAKLKLGGAAQTKDDLNYYYLSGTSMAAAEVSGLVALLLQDEPGLSNDQIKHRLINTADKAVTPAGDAAYAIWQQGAGRVNAVAAVDSASAGAANTGLNLALDRDHDSGTHFFGKTGFDPATQSFYLEDAPVGGGGYSAWAGGYSAWAGGYSAWAGGYSAWAGSTSVWSSHYPAESGGLAVEPDPLAESVLAP